MRRLSLIGISLPAALSPDLDALGRAPTVRDVVSWIRRIDGRRSLTFLDPADPRPGHAELYALADRYELDREALVAEVCEVLGGD